MRRLTISLVAAMITIGATAQHKSTIESMDGEKWWGAFTNLQVPLKASEEKFNMTRDNRSNQAVPFLVSSYGRYIWSDNAFDFVYDGKSFIIDSPTAPVQATKAGKTLREAFVVAANRHFPSDGTIPPEEFFRMAQWNTWIELMYDQNQADVEKYADQIIANGFAPGILMIDDNWQRYYGNFDFRAECFPDPKAMVEKLHKMGFKVMLWVSPFVSPDSREFRELEAKGYLVREKGSKEAAVTRWWNGYSACYDLTNPEAYAHLTSTLKNMQTTYGIDGFKLDAGDFSYYNPAIQDSHKADATPTDHSEKWCKLGLQFPFNEFRATWKLQGKPLVQRLSDKNYSWGEVASLIPQMLNAGVMGYAYTCPDMIGGGQFSSFLDIDADKFDQKLIVRSAQVHALMPMMQFSVAPWRVLDPEHMGYCRDAAKLHEKFAPYIIELAKESAKSGEPIIRYMEYMYPNKGFTDCQDQFMLGSKYLVAPILTPDGKRTVRLPRGVWTDDLGKKYKGPLVIEVNAPTGRLPYYELKR